jgi:hypothetical protein
MFLLLDYMYFCMPCMELYLYKLHSSLLVQRCVIVTSFLIIYTLLFMLQWSC